jgi:hypothetical protein
MRFKELIEKLNKPNDGTRTLFESIAIPEVEKALKDWNGSNHSGILIGGCAVGYYTRPRATTDVDILFLTKGDIPSSVNGFKKTRSGAFQHNETHVEIEVVSHESINISTALVQKVFNTAILSNGVKVASPSSLVALKLQRLKGHDIGDIAGLIKTGKVNLSGYPLSKQNLKDFEEIKKRFV